MKAIIFGASGMVGTEVLHHVLEDDRFEKVFTVGRSVLDIESPKLRQVVHKDYMNYSELEEYLAEADICFYCLGVYQSQVQKQEFWKITVDYLEALINELVKINNTIIFCLFSAQGASPDEKSIFLFGNAKGRAEKRLTDSNIESKYIFRPGFINPGRKSAMAGFALKIYQFLYKIFPVTGIDASDLAKFMIHISINGGSKAVYGNRDMRKLLTKN